MQSEGVSIFHYRLQREYHQEKIKNMRLIQQDLQKRLEEAKINLRMQPMSGMLKPNYDHSSLLGEVELPSLHIAVNLIN